MGLRCLLGHDFDEPELEREREEDGDEVVVTVREVKTCDRCGERQIVSENKEVTSIEQLAGEADRATDAEPAATDDDPTAPGVDDGPTAGSGPDAGPAADPSPVDAGAAEAGEGPATDVPDADGEDAVIIDDADGGAPADDGPAVADAEPGGPAGPGGDGQPPGRDGRTPGSDGRTPGGDPAADEDDGVILDDESATPDLAGAEETVDPAADAPAEEAGTDEDDGVILDEEAEADPDRDRGEWPDRDEDDVAADEYTPWPEQEGADEGYDAEVSDGEADVSFGGGLTPERTASTPTDGEETVDPADGAAGSADAAAGSAGDAGTADGEPSGSADGDADRSPGTGLTRADSPSLSTSMEETATEFFCPECGMTEPAGRSSMRAGDICPECRRGYVTERDA